MIQVGQSVLARYNGKVQEFKVITIYPEDLELSDGVVTIVVKPWEIGRVPND